MLKKPIGCIHMLWNLEKSKSKCQWLLICLMVVSLLESGRLVLIFILAPASAFLLAKVRKLALAGKKGSTSLSTWSATFS